MKMQSLKLFVAAAAIAIFTVSSAYAQQVLKFDVPFQFQIGKAKLDAGKYEMRQLDNSKYLLRNAETGKSSIVVSLAQAGTNESTKSEKLVFNRYGNVYFMRQLFVKTGTAGRELGESSAERKLRKNSNNDDEKLAKLSAERETIAVNAVKQ
jgi:hypothetical protein